MGTGLPYRAVMDPDGLLPGQYNELKQREVFDLFDKNGDGFISGSELGMVLRALGQNPSEKDIQEALRQADKDGDHVIKYEEYVDMLKGFTKDPQIFEIELREAFRIFDKDRNNNLNFVELRKALTSLGEPLTDEEAVKLCKLMDADGDRQVTVDEFVKYMVQGYDEKPSSNCQTSPRDSQHFKKQHKKTQMNV